MDGAQGLRHSQIYTQQNDVVDGHDICKYPYEGLASPRPLFKATDGIGLLVHRPATSRLGWRLCSAMFGSGRRRPNKRLGDEAFATALERPRQPRGCGRPCDESQTA